jgi:hypothetical protein
MEEGAGVLGAEEAAEEVEEDEEEEELELGAPSGWWERRQEEPCRQLPLEK